MRLKYKLGAKECFADKNFLLTSRAEWGKLIGDGSGDGVDGARPSGAERATIDPGRFVRVTTAQALQLEKAQLHTTAVISTTPLEKIVARRRVAKQRQQRQREFAADILGDAAARRGTVYGAVPMAISGCSGGAWCSSLTLVPPGAAAACEVSRRYRVVSLMVR